MINRVPGVGSISRLFSKHSPRQMAKAAIARILTQFEVDKLPFETGLLASRRDTDTRWHAIGGWMIPVLPDMSLDHLDFATPLPAVTSDIRADGIGVMLNDAVSTQRAVLALPDGEGFWRFFLTDIRHSSPRPGGWHHVGLQIDRLFEPNSLQNEQFRGRTTAGKPTGVGSRTHRTPAELRG